MPFNVFQISLVFKGVGLLYILATLFVLTELTFSLFLACFFTAASLFYLFGIQWPCFLLLHELRVLYPVALLPSVTCSVSSGPASLFYFFCIQRHTASFFYLFCIQWLCFLLLLVLYPVALLPCFICSVSRGTASFFYLFCIQGHCFLLLPVLYI